MLKMMGAVMTGASCAYFGLRMRLNLKTRQKSLADILTSLEALEGEIGFSENRLKKAFERVDRNGLFTLAAENIEQCGAKKAWCDAVNAMKNKLCLTDADCDALLTLGNNIGKTAGEEQIKSIRYVKSLITAQLAQASDNYSRHARLYSSGGVLVGALVVIVLM